MNLLLRILAAGSLLTAAHAFAADAFEGKVTFTMTHSSGKPQTMDYSIKDHRMRMDITVAKSDSTDDTDKPKKRHSLVPGFLGGKSDNDAAGKGGDSNGGATTRQVTTIMDLEKMEMTTLMPDQKMYMVMSLKKAVDRAAARAEHREAAAAATDVASTKDIERTGKTEKILGYSCEQIVVKDSEKGTVTELWVASGLGTFMGMGGGGPMGGGGGGMFGGHKSSSAAAAKWEEVLKGGGGFPMRVVTSDAQGNQTFKMEATAIEPGRQPEENFLPPPDYQKFTMPDLGNLNPFNRG